MDHRELKMKLLEQIMGEMDKSIASKMKKKKSEMKEPEVHEVVVSATPDMEVEEPHVEEGDFTDMDDEDLDPFLLKVKKAKLARLGKK